MLQRQRLLHQRNVCDHPLLAMPLACCAGLETSAVPLFRKKASDPPATPRRSPTDADLDGPGDPSGRDLRAAIAVGDVRTARTFLMRNRRLLNTTNISRRTLLHIAAQFNSAAAVRLLASFGAFTFVRDANGDTPLELGVWASSHAAVTSLIAAGSAVDEGNFRAQRGWSPVHIAAYLGDIRMLQILAGSGADLDAPAASGNAALHVAAGTAVHGAATIDALLNMHASISARNGRHQTALHVAAVRGNVEAVRTLVQRGADRDARDAYGATPLALAARHSRSNVVSALLQAGADTNAQSAAGRTPLVEALEASSDDSVALALLAAGADPLAVPPHHATAVGALPPLNRSPRVGAAAAPQGVRSGDHGSASDRPSAAPLAGAKGAAEVAVREWTAYHAAAALPSRVAVLERMVDMAHAKQPARDESGDPARATAPAPVAQPIKEAAVPVTDVPAVESAQLESTAGKTSAVADATTVGNGAAVRGIAGAAPSATSTAIMVLQTATAVTSVDATAALAAGSASVDADSIIDHAATPKNGAAVVGATVPVAPVTDVSTLAVHPQQSGVATTVSIPEIHPAHRPLDARDMVGQTALHVAAHAANHHAVRVLLKAVRLGLLSDDARDDAGRTAVDVARDDVVREMLLAARDTQ